MSGYPRGIAVGLAVVLCFVLASCDQAGHPTTSSLPPTATPPKQTSVTLSGVVFDHTANGTVPRANVALLVHAWNSNAFISVTSDASGRYRLAGVPVGAISIAAAGGSGYYAPCPAGWDVVEKDQVFDVHVVSASLLSTTGVPANLERGSIWVSGVAFERTPQGGQPVGGATVNLLGDGSDSRVGSTTLTDAAGRYVVCPPLPGTGTDQPGLVRITREGYEPASRTASLGWDYTGFDIELVRD